MKWDFVFGFSLFGIAMGAASLFGLTQGIEWLLWLVIALICAFVFAQKLETGHFLAALMAGLFMSVLNGLIQAAFFDMYLSNNTMTAERFQQIPGGVDARIFVLIASVIIGAVYGSVMGLFALLARKFVKKNVI